MIFDTYQFEGIEWKSMGFFHEVVSEMSKMVRPPRRIKGPRMAMIQKLLTLQTRPVKRIVPTRGAKIFGAQKNAEIEWISALLN